MRPVPAILLATLLAGGPAHAQLVDAGVGNPLAAIPAESVRDALSRPLFSPNRRPPSPLARPLASPEPVVPLPSADQFRLLGTLVGPSAASAVILDTTSGTARTLTQGESVNGWRLASIEPALVRLEQGPRNVTLALFRPGVPAPAGAIAPGRPAPLATPTQIAPPTPVASSPGGAPPGTVAGTAAAQVAAESPFRLTFGAPPPAPSAP